MPSARRSDVELANLNNVPHSGHFVSRNNILYTVTGVILDSDIASLPQISREQITMCDFLGSGAFGEVYEGTVKSVTDETETRVAIKTLRKGATDQEKNEFLEEAKLMSNFKHKHILSLIGVYLDVDALYIIMELMQGGDLLSFLRQSRPCEVSNAFEKNSHSTKDIKIGIFTGWPLCTNAIGFNNDVRRHCIRMSLFGRNAFRSS